MVFTQSIFAQGTAEGEYVGKTVILHTNDIHGAIENYEKIAGLKQDFIDKGARVLLVDAGDFSQGTTNVSYSEGLDAILLMNEVGYDLATLGNHEFDYGYTRLTENLAQADFRIAVANILDEDGDYAFTPGYVYHYADGLDVGFFGLNTPESQTKANPLYVQGLNFLKDDAFFNSAQIEIDALKASGADLVICLSHLGVDASSIPYTSYDLLANTTGIDFVIDGHSHTIMESGQNGEAIASTGTEVVNVGVIVIDNDTAEIEENYLIASETLTTSDAEVAALAEEISAKIQAEYGQVFAQSLVDINGSKEPGNRTEETNNGDLVTDAMMWIMTKDEGAISVKRENVIAIQNGGSLRAPIKKGEITRNDITTDLPFGNTIVVSYVKGSELLEILEASTFCTPISLGGFPQVAGIEYTIDTTKAYDKNDETYPASTYYGPKSIQRVTINNVNGKPFDINETYAVIGNDFCSAGGDTYFALSNASSKTDTGIKLDEAVMQYIVEELDGVIGEEYANPQGRIHVILPEEEENKPVTIGGLDSDIWFTKYGNVYMDIKVEDFFEMGYGEGDIVNVTFNGQTVALPVVPTYSYVDQGVAAIIASLEDGKPTGYLSMAINMGNFGEGFGLAYKTTNPDKTWYWTAMDGVQFPIVIEFEMAEDDGYMAQYILHDLNRTNVRTDYSHLSDAQFANFRNVATTGMGANKLYRTSSPIDPSLQRNVYADKEAEKAGIKTIMNLSNSSVEVTAFENFVESYYSKQQIIFLNLGVDFQAAEFKKGLAEGLRFFASHKGPYIVHCAEGKDRAGFISAMLECLMGATIDEVVADYMVTYYNYYGIEKGTEKYTAIANSNIIKSLQTAFGVTDLNCDLSACAKAYITNECGLTEAELTALMNNLR